jgi:hypothetical protein
MASSKTCLSYSQGSLASVNFLPMEQLNLQGADIDIFEGSSLLSNKPKGTQVL